MKLRNNILQFKRKRVITIFYLLFLLLIPELLLAQSSFQITELNNPAPGYIRFSFQSNENFFLVDNYGKVKYEQKTLATSNNFTFLDNGNWAQIGDNKFYIYNQNLQVIDTIPNPTSGTDTCYLEWHDIIHLSNGHYLLLLSQMVKKDMSTVVEGGKSFAQIISNVLIETDRTGKIYWKWKPIEHYNITDVTYAIDLTQSVIDLTHINSFIEDTDGNIIISVRNYDEISKIDKSTGNFIWRFGGSECKNNQFTYINDDQNGFIGFSHQHSITLSGNNKILMYDNGTLKNQSFSRAVEYKMDFVNKIATKIWEYRAVPDIYQQVMGSVQRLPNGNTLINWGKLYITEVRPDNTIAFNLMYSDNTKVNVYRAYRIVTKMDAVSKDILNTGEYSFNDGSNTTGVNVNIQSKIGSGNSSVEKHYYLPDTTLFSDTTFTQLIPLRWVFNRTGISNLSANIKIKASSVNNLTQPEKAIIYARDKEGDGIFYELNTSYNSTSGEISADFNTANEFILGMSLLSAPKLIEPANGSLSQIYGLAKWYSVQAAKMYQIQFDTSATFMNPLVNKFVQKENVINFDSLIHGETFYWRVRAISAKDTSIWSNIFSFNTYLEKPKIFYPSDGTYSHKLNDSISWYKVDFADTYHLQVSTSKLFTTLFYENEKLTKEGIILPNLNYNTKYFIRLKAISENNISEWSNVISFYTLLKAPKLIEPANNQINVGIESKFAWDNDFDSPLYRFQISEDSSFVKLFLDSNLTQENIKIINRLSLGKKYFWRVKKYNENNTSDWSEIFNFTTLEPQLELNFPKGGEVLIHDSIYQIQWESKNVDLIKIYLIKNDVENYLIADSVQGNLNNFKWSIPSDLQEGAFYKVRINDFENIKISSESENYFSIISLNSAILPKADDWSVNISPNPSDGNFVLNCNILQDGKYTLEIYDIIGNLLQKTYSDYLGKGKYSFNQNLSFLENGIYFYKIQSGNKKFSCYLLIIK